MTGERRQTSKVEFTDGNGRKATAYNVLIGRTRAIIGTAAAAVGLMITVGTVSCAGVRFGLDTTIRDAIDKSVAPPDGRVHRHVCETAKEFDRQLEDSVREEIDQVENQVIELTTQQKILVRSISNLGQKIDRITE